MSGAKLRRFKKALKKTMEYRRTNRWGFQSAVLKQMEKRFMTDYFMNVYPDEYTNAIL